MFKCDIPGFGLLSIKNLVLDYNGTMAIDGNPIAGVKENLQKLSALMDIHILTADTFGTVKQNFEQEIFKVSILQNENQAKQKEAYVQKLGIAETIVIGNGRNDRLMLKTAKLGILVIQQEGASGAALGNADIIVPDILSALKLFIEPKRLIASLRD